MKNDIKLTHDNGGVMTYYTPAIEEFHVGFEYEFHGLTTGGLTMTDFLEGNSEVITKPHDKIWYKETVVIEPPFSSRTLKDIRDLFKSDQIRVRFLDRKDFDELYFRMDGVTSDYRIGVRCSRYVGYNKMDGIQIIHNPGTHHIMIIRHDIAVINFIEAKNKSRLTQILQWVGAINESIS